MCNLLWWNGGQTLSAVSSRVWQVPEAGDSKRMLFKFYSSLETVPQDYPLLCSLPFFLLFACFFCLFASFFLRKELVSPGQPQICLVAKNDIELLILFPLTTSSMFFIGNILSALIFSVHNFFHLSTWYVTFFSIYRLSFIDLYWDLCIRSSPCCLI